MALVEEALVMPVRHAMALVEDAVAVLAVYVMALAEAAVFVLAWDVMARRRGGFPNSDRYGSSTARGRETAQGRASNSIASSEGETECPRDGTWAAGTRLRACGSARSCHS